MAMNEVVGNMYDWVTNTHSHWRGSCPHDCTYCSSKKGRAAKHYQGPLRLAEKELKVNYYKPNKNGLTKGKTIFIDHMTDLFADGVPNDGIEKVLKHCNEYPENTYVFQTRNTRNAFLFSEDFPPRYMIGTTIETNSGHFASMYSKAPLPFDRAAYLALFRGVKRFVTVEPAIMFNPQDLATIIIQTKPSFVNIGADSKNCDLLEPTMAQVYELQGLLEGAEIEVRFKDNLRRIVGC